MRGLVPLLILALLAGCASAPQDSADWQFEGKVSLSAAGETQVAAISWVQTDEHSSIRLSGPVGMGAVRIQVDGASMEIVSGEGTRLIPLDAPVEVDGRHLILPWRAMAMWVRGLTETGQPIPREGWIAGEWQIRVLRRGEAGPRLVSIQHPTASLRLSVSKWLISGR